MTRLTAHENHKKQFCYTFNNVFYPELNRFLSKDFLSLDMDSETKLPLLDCWFLGPRKKIFNSMKDYIAYVYRVIKMKKLFNSFSNKVNEKDKEIINAVAKVIDNLHDALIEASDMDDSSRMDFFETIIEDGHHSGLVDFATKILLGVKVQSPRFREYKKKLEEGGYDTDEEATIEMVTDQKAQPKKPRSTRFLAPRTLFKEEDKSSKRKKTIKKKPRFQDLSRKAKNKRRSSLNKTTYGNLLSLIKQRNTKHPVGEDTTTTTTVTDENSQSDSFTP